MQESKVEVSVSPDLAVILQLSRNLTGKIDSRNSNTEYIVTVNGKCIPTLTTSILRLNYVNLQTSIHICESKKVG